ncbi:MAG: DUF4129 domain-containing protein [Dehalococcoidia bacterium]
MRTCNPPLSPFRKGGRIHSVGKFSLEKGGLALLLVVVILLATPAAGGPVLAQEPPVKHENPDTAESTQDPISISQYYSEALDYLRSGDPKAASKILDKISFANVPEGLKHTMNELKPQTMELVNSSVGINERLNKISEFMEEFQLGEAQEMANMTAEQIDRRKEAIDKIYELVQTIGEQTGAAPASPGSQLRKAYDELMSKVENERERSRSDKSRLDDILLGERALEKVRPTKISFGVDPATAFVGEEVGFLGKLTSKGKPLAGRKIVLLLDGTEYDSAVTGDDGWYEGTFDVPYNYVSEISLEALYRPHNEDTGTYLASKSPPVKLDVMFYKGSLLLELDNKAHPGLETIVRGKFDYEEAPGLQTREIEIYFDDQLIERESVSQEFSVPVKIDPDTHPGRHIVTVSAAGSGRHAPIVSSEYLEVARIKTMVDLSLPIMAFVPGNMELTGKAYSEAGPVKNGDIQLKLGTAETTCQTSEDGTFSATLSKGAGLELIGSQSINVKVIPDDAWHAQVSSRHSVFVVNWVNSSGIVIILVVLVFVVRRRLSGFALPRHRKSKESLTPVPFPATPGPSGAMYTSDEEMPRGDPGKRILSWYQRVVRMLVTALGLGIGSSQTLREFLQEVTPRLGPMAGFFEELTHFVERILYSGNQPTDEEARRAEEISREVEEKVRDEQT